MQKMKPDWNETFLYEDGQLFWKGWRSGRDLTSAAGHHNGNGYLRVCISGKRYYVHRIVWEMHNGPCGDSDEIDHIDANRSNNRIENLRLVSRSKNMLNPAYMRADNTSGIRGVSWHKQRGKWTARIKDGESYRHLGLFETKGAAAAAYQAAMDAVWA